MQCVVGMQAYPRGVRGGAKAGGGRGKNSCLSRQTNSCTDLHCLGLNLVQPLALTLQSRLVVSEQRCAAAHGLHPAPHHPHSYNLSTRRVSAPSVLTAGLHSVKVKMHHHHHSKPYAYYSCIITPNLQLKWLVADTCTAAVAMLGASLFIEA